MIQLLLFLIASDFIKSIGCWRMWATTSKITICLWASYQFRNWRVSSSLLSQSLSNSFYDYQEIQDQVYVTRVLTIVYSAVW